MSMLDLYINRALARVGLSLKRTRPRRDANALLALKCHELGVRTMLDIGANTGQFASEIRQKGWAGPIISFEPIPEVHAELARAAAKDDNWHVAPACALGSRPGRVAIRVSLNRVSSSLLEVTEHSTRIEPATAFETEVEVALHRLDELVEEKWEAPFAMKIDTQGAELEVLKGARAVLARTSVALIEMSLATLYKGGARSWEIISFMEDEGFRCIAMPEGFADTAAEEVLQVDGIFVRSVVAASA